MPTGLILEHQGTRELLFRLCSLGLLIKLTKEKAQHSFFQFSGEINWWCHQLSQIFFGNWCLLIFFFRYFSLYCFLYCITPWSTFQIQCIKVGTSERKGCITSPFTYHVRNKGSPLESHLKINHLGFELVFPVCL